MMSDSTEPMNADTVLACKWHVGEDGVGWDVQLTVSVSWDEHTRGPVPIPGRGYIMLRLTLAFADRVVPMENIYLEEDVARFVQDLALFAETCEGNVFVPNWDGQLGVSLDGVDKENKLAAVSAQFYDGYVEEEYESHSPGLADDLGTTEMRICFQGLVTKGSELARLAEDLKRFLDQGQPGIHTS
jgi:hypothetical protein